MPLLTLPVSYTAVTLIGSLFPAVNSVSTINSGSIAYYCGMVEAEINTRLVKRYNIPFTVECPILTAIATREAIYRIATQRALVQFPPAQQGQHPMQAMHVADQRLLDEIVDGDIELVDSSGNVITPNAKDMLMTSTTVGYDPTMHEGRFEDMVVDPTKLDDILTERAIGTPTNNPQQ